MGARVGPVFACAPARAQLERSKGISLRVMLGGWEEVVPAFGQEGARGPGRKFRPSRCHGRSASPGPQGLRLQIRTT